MNLPVDSIPLHLYSTQELLQLRTRINQNLPACELATMDLQSELVLAFQEAKALHDAYKGDDETALNQKVQAVNSLTTTLKALADMQKQLLDAAYTQRLERHLIATLKQFPEMHDHFLALYEKDGPI